MCQAKAVEMNDKLGYRQKVEYVQRLGGKRLSACFPSISLASATRHTLVELLNLPRL